MTYRERFFGGPLDGIWSEADTDGDPPPVVEVVTSESKDAAYELALVVDRPDGGKIALYRAVGGPWRMSAKSG